MLLNEGLNQRIPHRSSIIETCRTVTINRCRRIAYSLVVHVYTHITTKHTYCNKRYHLSLDLIDNHIAKIYFLCVTKSTWSISAEKSHTIFVALVVAVVTHKWTWYILNYYMLKMRFYCFTTCLFISVGTLHNFCFKVASDCCTIRTTHVSSVSFPRRCQLTSIKRLAGDPSHYADPGWVGHKGF